MSHCFARLTALALTSIFLACGGDGPTGDNSPPEAVSFSPTVGANGVARTAAISVTLSERVDPATVNATTFTITAVSGVAVAGTISVEGNVLTFTPSAPLAHGTSYVVRVTDGIRDLAGNPLPESVTWSFVVAPNVPPVVLSTNPGHGAQGVDGTRPLSLTFSEPIAAPAGSFRLFTSAREIPGTITVDGSTLTFTPLSRLPMGALLTAVITTAIRDLDGAPLVAGQNVSFRTAVDSAPEHVASRVAVGVAVMGERLEAPGDIDDFYLHGMAGAEWVVFIQSSPTPWGDVQISLIDSLTGNIVNSTFTPASYSELEAWSLGRVVLPRTGSYRVRVTGQSDDSYAFRVDVVNRAPESSPATLAAGTIITESIGTVADVDEFRFAGTAGQEMNVFLQLLSGLSGGLMLELEYDGRVLHRLETSTPAASLDQLSTGRITLPGTGTYTIRLYGPHRGANVQKTGDYRFEFMNIDTRPENGATIRLDGPPIAGAIERPGDVDVYEFSGTAGQLVVLHLVGEGVQGGDIFVQLLGTDGTRYTSAVTGERFGHSGVNYSRRVALPYTGTYRLRVQGTIDWLPARGSYMLEAYTVSPAPEHVPATIALGQTVSGEQIDRPGDLDVFTFVGEAGREANLFLGWAETNEELWAHLGVMGMFTRPGTLALDGQSTGRFPLADSTYTVIVDSHWSTQQHMMHSAGPYAFRVFPIDRKPETRGAAYTLGDTVTGEVLYPAGDIDEYTFELTETTTLEVFWDGSLGGAAGILYPAGSRESGVAIGGGAPATRTITLQAGRYEVVVLDYNARVFGDQFVPKPPTVRYRFVISRKASQ